MGWLIAKQKCLAPQQILIPIFFLFSMDHLHDDTKQYECDYYVVNLVDFIEYMLTSLLK